MSRDETPVLARECAPLVGSSISALYRMAQRKIIPCVRTGVRGRGLRFIPREVRQALQERPAWSKATRAVEPDSSMK